MPASPWFPDLETLGSGVGGVILSSRVRDGNQACKGWGPWGDAPGQPPREQSQDPSPSYRKALGDRRAGRAHVHQTTLPAWPEALRGSWREAQRAGQEETLLAQLHIRQPRNILCFLPPPSPPAQDGAGNAVE